MRTVLMLLAAVVALFGLASEAMAVDQSTHWYTLNIQSTPDAQPLFLTNTSEGVKLQPYRSGDPTQMWALVQPDYPTAPAVTGEGPPIGFFCSIDEGGCEFRGGAGAPIRIVNRASGGCLLFAGSVAKTSPCVNTKPKTAAAQKWQYFLRDQFATGVGETLVSAGACLVALPNKYDPLDRVAASGKCKGNPDSRFIPQLAAELSCRTDWWWELCFVAGR